jgi:hypothetical protein
VENGLLRRISTRENFPQKENFVKCDWPAQMFRLKKMLKLKIFNFFGKFSVRGNFSSVDMGLQRKCSREYNLQARLSQSKNAIVHENVFITVAFPKLTFLAKHRRFSLGISASSSTNAK